MLPSKNHAEALEDAGEKEKLYNFHFLKSNVLLPTLGSCIYKVFHNLYHTGAVCQLETVILCNIIANSNNYMVTRLNIDGSQRGNGGRANICGSRGRVLSLGLLRGRNQHYTYGQKINK